MKGKPLLVFFLFCCANSICAQNRYMSDVDSLKYIIKTLPEDTSKLQGLLNLAGLYTYNNPDSAILYGNSAIQLSIRLNAEQETGLAYSYRSSAFAVLGNYSQAMKDIFEARKIFIALGNKAFLESTNGGIGDIYLELGDYKKALFYYYQARETAANLNIIPTSSFSKELWEMYSSASLGDAYLHGNMLDSALYFSKRVYEIDRSLNQYWSFSTLLLANTYLSLNELDSALKYYRAEVRVKAKKDETDVYVGIATIFQKRNIIDSCSYYANKALDTAQSIKYTKAVMTVAGILAWVYEKTDPAKSIFYLKLNATAKDSIYSREKIDQVGIAVLTEETQRQEMLAQQAKYKDRIKMYTLFGIIAVILLIAIILYRNNRIRQRAFKLLRQQKLATDSALVELKTTQDQLIQSEKMASLGELTAGIAHEIQNPLNFINNFSEVNAELVDEMKQELQQNHAGDALKIAEDLKENNLKIFEHGKRADGIVKSMLQHSRVSSGQKELTDINELANEYFRLSYHGMRAKDKAFNVDMKINTDQSVGKINILPQDIGRVLLNLYNNAFYSVAEKKKLHPEAYEPTVTLSTKRTGQHIQISVKDNGMGIPQKIRDKVFQPFFTTKPTGQGTGLGLSLSYDIIKSQGGHLKIESIEGEGAEFIIELPAT